MRRSQLSSLFSLLCLCSLNGVAPSSRGEPSQATASSSTKIQLSESLQLFLLTPEIFRVCAYPPSPEKYTDPPQKPLPHVVEHRDWEEVEYTIEEKGDYETIIELEESGISIIYYRASQQLAFRNQEGVIVVQEGERSISNRKEDNYYTVEQSFLASSDDELLLGGGQFQAGYLNWLGSPLFLQQRNTETSVPFFVSSAGYGLLWETSASTWLNPLDFSEELKMSNNTLTFTASSDGPHYFTLHCNDVVYGDSIQAVAILQLKNHNNPDDIHEPINWNSRNKPPTLTGRVMTLISGAQYDVTLTCENCCRSFHSQHNSPGLQLFVNRPTAASMSKHTLRTDTTQFIDYYLMIPSHPSSSPSSISTSATYFDSCISLYRSLTGTAPLLPLYTYGFWFSKEHYATQQELLSAAEEFRSREIPVDGIVQDWKYWGDLEWSPQWDSSIYPNPEDMVRQLHGMNFHIMVSVWCKFENASYLKQAYKSKQLVAHTNWLDMYQTSAQNSLYHMVNVSMYSIGVDSLWLDATEPEGLIDYDKYVYPYGRDKEGVPANSVLNTYSLAVTEGMTLLHGDDYPQVRPFHLTRSSYAGQQRTSGIVWSGDISGNIDMMRRQVIASVNYALSGHPYWSMDTGGFFRPDDQYTSKEYKELLTRWFQFAVFVPLFRYHGQGGELWLYGEKTLNLLRKIIQLRYRLLPYIYSLARRVEFDGYTIQRHFLFDFPWDKEAIQIEDSYMFGPCLLVAPVVELSVDTREVYLPRLTTSSERGNVTIDDNENDDIWYSFFSGVKYTGGAFINAEGSLNMGGPPLFVPAGSIVSLGPFVQHSGADSTDPLEVRIYKGRNGKFTLYEDGGYDFTYRENGYISIDLVWDDRNNSLTISAMKGEGYPDMEPSRIFNIVLVDEDKGVGIDSTASPDAQVEYKGDEVVVTVTP